MGNGVHGDSSYELKQKWMKKNSLVIHGVGVCMRGLQWFAKPTGFQDSEPGVGFGWFGAVTWAARRCRRLS
jgi:hypothetical protein